MKFYTDNLLKIWESESCVWLFTTPWIIQSMEFSQARILEGVTYPFSRGSSQPRDWTQVSINAGRFLPAEPQGKPKNTAVGSLSLLQQIFPTQELNWGLLHCRWILYQLSYEGSPWSAFVWGWGESATDCNRIQKNCWQFWKCSKAIVMMAAQLCKFTHKLL